MACGHHNADDATFCHSCGEYLEWKGQRTSSAAESNPDGAPHAATPPEPHPGTTQELRPVEPVCWRCEEPDDGVRVFCRRCGTRLRDSDTGELAALPAPRQPVWRRPALLATGTAIAVLSALTITAAVQQWWPFGSDEAAVGEPEPEPPPMTGSEPTPSPSLVPANLITPVASSALDRDGDIVYLPSRTLDGDLATAWNDGVEGPGIGEWLEYQFDVPVTLERIEMVNGYDKIDAASRDDRWEQNARVARMRVETETAEFSAQLEDTRQFQALTGSYGDATCRVRLTVLDVYPGAAFADVAVSEVRFLGSVQPGRTCPS